MDIRTRVKQLLRLVGHPLITTVHERLDGAELQLRDIQQRHETHQTGLAETQAILRELKRAIPEHLDTLRQQLQELRQMYGEQRLQEMRQMQIERHAQTHAAVLQIAESQTVLTQAAIHTAEILHELTRHTVVEASGHRLNSPEAGLLEFLYSYLPMRTAIDVGAHIGDLSACLLGSGYEVYAFEPNPPLYEQLVGRLGECKRFHPFRFAIGCEEGELPLHLAEDRSPARRRRDATLFSSLAPHRLPDEMAFFGTTPVPVKNLATLHRTKVIPEDVGLAKIDTEGFDLEVIRGMGEYRYPVVVAGFRDKNTPSLESLVMEMRDRGYMWHLVQYRIGTDNQSGYYANHSQPVPNSWGNVFFFRDHPVFSQAEAWCSAVLTRTYFRPKAE